MKATKKNHFGHVVDFTLVFFQMAEKFNMAANFIFAGN
jgi:hypothetical protein